MPATNTALEQRFVRPSRPLMKRAAPWLVAITMACDPSPKPEIAAKPETPPKPGAAEPKPETPPKPPPEPETPPEPKPQPVLPTFGEASLEEVVVALAARQRVDFESVRSCFPGYAIDQMYPDSPTPDFELIKDGETLAHLFTGREGLLQVSVEADLEIAGFRVGDPMESVIELPEARCQHNPGADCYVRCTLPSGWGFSRTLRRCAPEGYEPLSAKRAKQLIGRGKIQGIDWQPVSEE